MSGDRKVYILEIRNFETGGWDEFARAFEGEALFQIHGPSMVGAVFQVREVILVG